MSMVGVAFLMLGVLAIIGFIAVWIIDRRKTETKKHG